MDYSLAMEIHEEEMKKQEKKVINIDSQESNSWANEEGSAQ